MPMALHLTPHQLSENESNGFQYDSGVRSFVQALQVIVKSTVQSIRPTYYSLCRFFNYQIDHNTERWT